MCPVWGVQENLHFLLLLCTVLSVIIWPKLSHAEILDGRQSTRLCNLSSEGMLATKATLNAKKFCRLWKPLSQMLLETRARKGFKKLESSCMLPESTFLIQNSPETDQTCCFSLPILQLGKILWEREYNILQVQNSASTLPAAPRATASSPGSGTTVKASRSSLRFPADTLPPEVFPSRKN